MALQAWYNTGNVTISNGSASLVGSGTLWLAFIRPGDLFSAQGLSVRVLTVTDNTHITLADTWPGTNISSGTYEIRLPPPSADITADLRSLVEGLTSTIITEFGAVTFTEGDLLGYFGGILATVPSATFASLTGSQTLTNKTINASNNSISNLTTAMFAANVIDTDTTLSANSDTRIASQKAVKSYFDNTLTGLQWKAAVICATTANITLSGEQTIDGQLTSSSRVLVKNQTTGSQNGIYVSASGAWVRSTDADAGSELPSATVFVEKGTVNANTQWTCTNSSVTLGSTAVVFAQVSGAGTYSAGTGITLSGNQFSIASNAITYALFQQVAASSLVGNATGSLANATGITIGAALTFSGAALQTVAMTGDVTTSANSFATTVSKIQSTVVSGTTGSGNVVFSTSGALTSPTISSATITGGTHTAITGFGIRSTGAGFDLKLASTEVFTADRTLTVTLNNVNRSISLAGDINTAGSFTTSGAFALTLTQTALTNVTLPTTGTLATLAGSEILTNKTFNASNNTLSNITTSMFATNVIDTDNTLTANSSTRLATQSAVKGYVDALVQGLAWKGPVACVATSNITLSGEQTIDGVLTSSSRVLVKAQTTGSQNGIYISSSGAWTRATDADTGPELVWATTIVEGGSNAGVVFTCNTTSITLGTTTPNFVVAGVSTSTLNAGNGLSLSGSTISIATDVSTGSLTLTGSGAASTSPLKVNGTWYVAGNSTTNYPAVFITATGATVSNLNTNGSGLVVNAPSGFSAIGSLLELFNNGVSKHSFSGNGDMGIAGSITCLGASAVFGANAGQINSTDGFAVASNKYLAFSSTTGSNGTTDLFISRKGTANLQLGKADAATAVAQTFSVQSIAAGNNNVAGQNWLNIASLSTGSGTPGDYIIQTGFQGVAQNATVTMTIASPCVVSLTAHGFSAGQPVKFTTTGALPTGITASTVYYVISAGLTANAFEIAATVGGAAINTSGTQSGTHTIDTRGLVGPAVTALTIKGGTQAATFAGAVAVTGALTTATQSAGDNSTKAASTAYVDSVFQQKGTWTPFDNSGAGLTFTGISAGYTKIGNMVHAYWQFFYPATASGASTIVAGLPFTVASANSASQAFVSYTNVTTAQHFRLSSGGTSGNICDVIGNILTNATMSSGLFCGEAIYPVS